MTTELWVLLCVVGLQWALIMIEATPKLLGLVGGHGFAWAMGNRDAEQPDLPEWHKRLQRANSNLAENLPLFAVVVLVVHAAGAFNETTTNGAYVFLGARVLHAAVYVAGIPYVRTGIWFASIVGGFMVLSGLF